MSDIKLIHGDCLESLDILIEGGAKVDAIITDPPYNIVEKIGSNIHIFRQGEKSKDTSITRESMSFDIGFDQITWLSKVKKILRIGGTLILFNDWENMGEIAKELRSYKIKVKSLNHWQKTNPQPAEWKRRFVSGREYFLYCTNGGGMTFNSDKLNNGSLLYPLTKKSEKTHGKHPNQKPLSLMEDLIKTVTNKGDLIIDPFMGSGSTGVACKNLNRNFIGIEMDKGYFDIATKRINES